MTTVHPEWEDPCTQCRLSPEVSGCDAYVEKGQRCPHKDAARIAKLEQEVAEDERKLHAVRVCVDHAHDITTGDGCVVCELAAAQAENERLRAVGIDPEEWHRRLADAAQKGARDAETKLAALRADAAGRVERVMPEAFVDVVRESMATSWHEYVNDAHCHPSEFEMRRKELWANFERGGNWSLWVAQRIWLKARAVLAATDGEVKP